MSSIDKIPNMSSRLLTIMATRYQDQDLVSDVATKYGLKQSSDLKDSTSSCRYVIPSFGWHPWFSHQLFDDTDPSASSVPGADASSEVIQKFKTEHYTSILTPSPEDPEFISQLPTPLSLASFLEDTRSRVGAHPIAMVGEIGIDKAFRLPEKWPQGAAPQDRDDSLTPGGREGRRLSPHTVAIPHQIAILQAQLKLAGELMVPVSIHGVQAHGVLYDAISACWKGHERDVLSKRERRRVAPNAENWSTSDESDDDEDDEYYQKMRALRRSKKKNQASKPFPPRICLHSFSGSVEVLKRYIKPQVPVDVYFSVSVVVNLGTASAHTKFAEVVAAIPDSRLLVESDLHVAGPDMDAALEDIYRRVCEVKGWDLKEGVEKIATNFNAFIFGH
ncbi:hypothetical protein jhhlp_003844 [Lomentospora prolificans]|uniref:Cut9 interacting protein Scn1 n=1 Tax=Lomentospora prolificans TaxID=41688 RepID=A0A2N3N9X0_9PEZI|nr:hypothetical protein jhhlp_003844 [Lomentospora prolificans]